MSSPKSITSNHVILSVAYPTCNRPTDIKESILSLIKSVGNHNLNRIQILVCDNSDNDLTELAVNDISSSTGIRISYQKNEGNIGAGRNVLRCFKQASGKYVHVVSDQAYFEADYSRILPYLESCSAGALTFNYGIRGAFREDNPKGAEVKVTTYSSLDEVITSFHKSLTHLSTLVFKRDAIGDDLLESKEISESLIPQTHVLFQVLRHSTFDYLNLLCIRVFPRRTLNYDFLDVFCRDFLSLVRNSLPGGKIELVPLLRFSVWLFRMEMSLSYPVLHAGFINRAKICFSGYGWNPLIFFPLAAIVGKEFSCMFLKRTPLSL